MWDEWVVITNCAVAVTSILAAASTEHDAIRAMRDTTINLIRTIAGNPKATQEVEEDGPKLEKEIKKDESK